MSELSNLFLSIDPITIVFAFDLLLAIILGFIIGAEREMRNKDAGISTHIFVICGAMLFTFMSMTVDPASKSRILGAGLILKDGASVRNLTTAASIWFAGAIGMAIGFGYYGIAVIAALSSVFIPRIPHIKSSRMSGIRNKTRSENYLEEDEEVLRQAVDD
jgi:putative Mg2+ transporter-C (MgtC) family protein